MTLKSKILLAFSLIGAVAWAGENSVGPGTASVNYLDRMATMEATIAVLRKQAELNTAAKEANPPMFLPTVSAIYGAPDSLSARLKFPSGLYQIVKRGDLFVGRAEVIDISVKGVEARIGKRRVMLDFTPSTPVAGIGGNTLGGGVTDIPFPMITLPAAPTVSATGPATK